MKVVKKGVKLIGILVPFVVLFSASCASRPIQESTGLDVLCDIFEEAMLETDDLNLRLNYIKENVKNRVKSKDVVESMELIWQVAPQDRYLVYKQAVENELGREWECYALKLLII